MILLKEKVSIIQRRIVWSAPTIIPSVPTISRQKPQTAAQHPHLISTDKKTADRYGQPFDFLKSVCYVRKKSCLTCALNSCVKLTLVNSTSSRNSSGENLSALADKLAKLCGILIVNIRNLICTEDTNLLSLAHYGARRTVFILIHLMNPPILNLGDGHFSEGKIVVCLDFLKLGSCLRS